ncbi:MAG: nucleotidyltransferase domain-containing protein [Nanoarchaeota archaeon]
MKKEIKTKFENINKIAEKIFSNKNVKAVYLFGSYATGNPKPLSDIDLCVIGNLKEKDKIKISGYSSDNLDISFFDELPIYIKFRVFRDGKPLLIKDEKYLWLIKKITLNQYRDFKPIINKRIKEVFEYV